MKKLNTIIIGFIVGALSLGCEKEESLRTTCESKNGIEFTDKVGRIYKMTLSEPHFFYIGNPIPVTSGINGGFYPCKELPVEFQIEGLLVMYSGIDKGSLPDTGDPNFAFVTITKIEKVK
jgi:hypothetical protein